MYKIAIIYAGATYESALNHIRLQELLGKIKVIGIGTQDIYAEYVDGYPVTTIENNFATGVGLSFELQVRNRILHK